MTKACRGRIWAMGDLLIPCKIQCDSLGPSNAGARAAISFVEKKVVLSLAGPRYRARAMSMLDTNYASYNPDSQIHLLFSVAV